MSDALAAANQLLTKSDIDNPAFDARLLIAHALDIDRLSLVTQSQRELTENEQLKINELITRRATREPVARILGLREFWGLPFALNEATLEPRPDSETLIEATLNATTDKTKTLKILDLGTGTGCLLLSLLHEMPNATGLGIDIAPHAVRQATENAQRLNIQNRVMFQQGNWLDGIIEQFDLIISNPPYIRNADIKTLSPEVKHFDPITALDGGADGYDPYLHLIPLLPARLNTESTVCFEVGQGQGTTVAALLKDTGFTNISTHNDLGGITRAIIAQKTF